MKRALIAAALFIVCAIIYFLPVDFVYRMCIPLAILTVASIGKLPWQMCLAFFFSFMGDASSCSKGWLGHDTAFLCQMGNFAIAHVFFIIFFIRQWSSKAFRNRGLVYGSLLGLVALVTFIMLRVVPQVPAGVTRYGVAGYSLVISGMLFCALMTRDWLWSLSAALFVYSDFILAWNAFCSPVPGQKYLIMLPYYGAQLLFFMRSMSKAAQGYKLLGSHRS